MIGSRWFRRVWGVPPALYYVSDQSGWVLDQEWAYLQQAAREKFPDLNCRNVKSVAALRHGLIHYSSLWQFIEHSPQTHRSNRQVATIFHGSETADDGAIQAGVAQFKTLAQCPQRVVTASRIMLERLEQWGVPRERLQMIPLGVNTKVFQPVSLSERAKIRERFGIPASALCVGSFQKDGNGWEEGLEPKRIKGPDIFVEVMRRLARQVEPFVLLTGPARGFVKEGLRQAGIPFRHDVLADANELPDYYRALDLYVVTSREEGGPKALPESMASGVPLVSTRVGMAPDMIEDGKNGFLCQVEDVTALTTRALELISQPTRREQFVAEGLRTVKAYEATTLAERYVREVYAPFLR